MTHRIAIVEDDANYRTSLITVLDHAPGFACASAFRTAEAYLDALPTDAAAPWTMVLMDIALPGLGGIEATRRSRQVRPALPVVMLTAFEDPPRIVEAICAGADGYLLKRTGARELLTHLDSISHGGAPLTAAVARTVLDVVRGRRSRPVDNHDITARERDVLTALVRGLSYKEVAADLGISLETVRTHIKSLYRKLQVSNVAEAVSRALRTGLVSSD